MAVGRRFLLAVALCGALPAQELSLASRVSAPLVYVAVEPTDDAPDGADWTADLKRIGVDLNNGSADETLQLLRRVLAGGQKRRIWSGLELALTAIMPRRAAPDTPLLICRAQLLGEAADLLRTKLESGSFVRRGREVGGQQLYLLGGPAPSSAAHTPGAVVELALVGSDLVISNSARAMDHVFGVETTSSQRPVLAADDVYRELLDKLDAGPRSVLMYANVARLQQRLSAFLGGDPSWFLRWSGLASAEHAMLAIRKANKGAGTRTSVLLRAEEAPDGWLAAVERSSARELARHLPVGGVGGAVFAIEPAKLITADPAGGAQGFGMTALRASLQGGCSQLGLDLERQVLNRLGKVCGVHVYDVSPEGPRAEAVVSLQAKNRDAARRLLAECKQNLAQSPAVSVRQGVQKTEQVVVSAGAKKMHLGVVDDAFALTFDDGAMDRAVLAAAKSSSRDRQRLAREVLASLQKLGANKRRKLSGVFRFDLGQMAPNGGNASGETSSYVLCRHTGYLVTESGLMRLEVLSE